MEWKYLSITPLWLPQLLMHHSCLRPWPKPVAFLLGFCEGPLYFIYRFKHQQVDGLRMGAVSHCVRVSFPSKSSMAHRPGCSPRVCRTVISYYPGCSGLGQGKASKGSIWEENCKLTAKRSSTQSLVCKSW